MQDASRTYGATMQRRQRVVYGLDPGAGFSKPLGGLTDGRRRGESIAADLRDELDTISWNTQPSCPISATVSHSVS